MATFITGLIVLVVTLTAIFILIKDKKNGKNAIVVQDAPVAVIKIVKGKQNKQNTT